MITPMGGIRGRLGRPHAATALLVLVAGCGAAHSSAPTPVDALPPTSVRPVPTTAVPTVPPCPDSGLVVSDDRWADGAMGLRALNVYVTNCGTKPRTVDGYATVHVLDENHNRVEATAHRGTSVTLGVKDPGPHRLVLKPGDRAQTAVVWRNLVTSGTVVATDGAFLEVSPAPGVPPQIVPASIDLGNTTVFDVLAWQRPLATTGDRPVAPSRAGSPPAGSA